MHNQPIRNIDDAIDDLKSMGPVEAVFLVIMIVFICLTLYGAIAESGPLWPLINILNEWQISINQKFFDRSVYYPKGSVIIAFLMICIPYNIIRYLERSISNSETSK